MSTDRNIFEHPSNSIHNRNPSSILQDPAGDIISTFYLPYRLVGEEEEFTLPWPSPVHRRYEHLPVRGA